MGERRRITSEEQLRAVVGEPMAAARNKERSELHEMHRRFLAAARLFFVATADSEGNLDVSPRGEPAGSIVVLDDRTIALPERPGNRRADSLTNLLVDPHIAIDFLIPGRGDTLRVNGAAEVLADADYAHRMTVDGKPPVVIVEVAIATTFFHCSKAFLRSHSWEPQTWPSGDDDHGVPRRAVIAKQVEMPEAPLEDLDRYYGPDYGRGRLY